MIVAEAGINHNGDLGTAIDMVYVAKDAGADAIKFQIYYEDSICAQGIDFTYQSNGYEVTEDMRDMFNDRMLSDDDWRCIKSECANTGIEFMATPMCEKSLMLTTEIGIKRIKVASSDLTNMPLLQLINCTGLPVILSSGMGNEHEIMRAIGVFDKGQRVHMLLCTSEYPTPPSDVNIMKMARLHAGGLCRTGISDHTIGNTAAVMATAMGATYFEKHFTLDTCMDGPDHWFSANPEQLKSWVDAIREAKTMLGSGKIEPTAIESENKKLWQKNKDNGYVRRA